MYPNLPKITIITPSLNQGEYIQQTIESVINQDYSNLEYFIFDGRSTDDTLNIIKRFQNRITYWESVQDNGQSHAINKGLKRSTGDIVNWLNSDDYYKPDAFNIIASYFGENSTLNCFIGIINYINTDGTSYLSQSPIFESIEKTAGYGRVPQAAMFFTKEAYNHIGLLNERLKYCMDLEWWIKYLLIYGMSHIGQIFEVLVNFRMHNTSKTISQNSGFEVERDSIYYSIAKQLNLVRQAKAIQDLGNVSHTYTFTFTKDMNIEVAKKMVDYFLFLRGDEYYVKYNKSSAEACFSSINVQSLSNTDKSRLAKVRFKNKYLTSSLIKFFRKK